MKKVNQITSHLLMIRPVDFHYNKDTAGDNAFQNEVEVEDLQSKVENEFDNFVSILREKEIDVTVLQDTAIPSTPDSIFPNNWASYHEDGKVILYPMLAENRREERNKGVVERLSEKFEISSTVDYTHYENEQQFVEGTGSLILDKPNRITYACLSQRTNKELAQLIADNLGYELVSFTAVDKTGNEIYHTNVMLCIAEKYAVVCLECIPSEEERIFLKQKLVETEKEIIEISLSQVEHFAGNMLQVCNQKGERFLVMSSEAYRCLSSKQVEKIKGYNEIIHSDLYWIETIGGGSARCMLAEVFLEEKS